MQPVRELVLVFAIMLGALIAYGIWAVFVEVYGAGNVTCFACCLIAICSVLGLFYLHQISCSLDVIRGEKPEQVEEPPRKPQPGLKAATKTKKTDKPA